MTDPYKQADRARWLRDLLCGALIGAGAILPGVSGGVLAVVFDVYRPMMETLAHPGRGIRKYWHIFLPLGIGWAVGFLGLAKGISVAYALSDAATVWLFIGLIAGTFPALWREAGKEGHGRAAWIACGVCALSVFLTLFYVRHVLRVTVTPNFGWYNFCGALWGASVVLPGLTSSSIMMALGLYEPLLNSLAEMRLLTLSACLPGMLLAMLLLARGVTWLLQTHYAVTFHGILGIVAASTLVIVPIRYDSVGEAVASLSEPQMEHDGTALPVVEQMEGAAVAAVCRALETEYMHLRAISNHIGDKRSEWRVAEAVEALGAAAAAMDE